MAKKRKPLYDEADRGDVSQERKRREWCNHGISVKSCIYCSPRLKFLTPVKFVLSSTERKIADQFAFKEGQHFLFLGEIPGMSGHCAVADKKGVVHWAYHTDNFKALTEEEI